MSCSAQKSKYRHKISENKQLYSTLQVMKARCYRRTHPRYPNYGGRGIKVCDEWKNLDTGFDAFADWALSHGYEPGLTIDRIDVNGDYCPENCRWATQEEQAHNKQNTIWIDFRGERVQLAVICKRLGLNYQSVHYRLYNLGMDPETALTLPKQTVTERFLKCKEHGMNPSIVKDRVLKLGWDLERALTTPPRKLHRKKSHSEGMEDS